MGTGHHAGSIPACPTMNLLCPRCSTCKSVEDFNKSRARASGRQVYCRICQRGIDRQLYAVSAKRRAKLSEKNVRQRTKVLDFVRSYKAKHSCQLCPEKSVCCLDFHHLHSKEFDVATGANRAYALRHMATEMRKCVLLCANCHRKVHAGLLSTCDLLPCEV